jgi:hypothetical protein
MLQAPFMAFYSGDLYRDVGLNWTGTGFAYLFLLLLACMVPKAVQLQFSLRNFAENSAPAVITQVPEIKIANGEASALVVQPYTIRDPESGKPLAIVDTTGATVSLDGSDAFLLLKKTEIVVKRNALDTRSVSLKEIRNFTLNQNVINRVVNLVRSYGVLVFAVLALIGAFIYRLVQALIYGALGLAIAGLLGTSVTYGRLLRLSVMAVTPVILVSTVVAVTRFNVPHFRLLCFAAAMGFLYLGIKSVAGRQEPVPPAPGGQSAAV